MTAFGWARRRVALYYFTRTTSYKPDNSVRNSSIGPITTGNMSDSHMKQDIAHYFGDAVADDEDLRTECACLPQIYRLLY